MKILKPVVFLLFVLSNIGCEGEVEQYDFERYKFVSFIDEEVSVPETYTADNETPYPIYLRYDGSVLDEDFTVNLNITGINAKEGVDYSVKNTTVTFKAGDIKSEPFNITMIDDQVNSPEDRSLEIEIESVSNPKIDIGVGIKNQSNKSLVLHILDNECSSTIDVFNASDINSSAGNHTVTGSVSGSVVTLNGELIDYGPFPNAELGVTLTPAVEGATAGDASFDDYDAGTDNDGYVYQFRQNGEGTYDVCAGEIHVDIDVYYESGGAWVYWYTSSNLFSTP
ncbi:DUF1735 domain-containing protein [Flavobacteriaceae bacterium F89]|uniref:DUF1735 domain-containing protein n=1 Tax=Cerina litoralis TaxID=2874477 RepID=A0AAE3EVR7_9FLAO|nr:Calx-beta domain-containing protein [Cerina litoralis]MCG2461485.1 DUF1735 domain-containing protein [Cerina litoralis]